MSVECAGDGPIANRFCAIGNELSEDSILATLAKTCSEGLTAARRCVAWWHSADLGAPEAASEVEVRLNVDFDARDLTAVVAAWQAGAVIIEQMQDVLRRGEVLPITAAGEGDAS